jgi:hypothetical protein
MSIKATSKPRLSRRAVLRSAAAAGVALALPPLELMLGAREARADTAKRVLIFQYPHGLFLPDWFPGGSGSSWTPSLLMQRQGDDPASIDADLESIRGDINIVTGLCNSHHRTDAHTGPNNGFLTASVDQDTWQATGPSLDEVIATELGQGSFFPALRLSIYRNIAYDDMSSTVCFDAAGQPIQPMTSPSTLYGMLTGLVAPAGEPTSNFPRDFRQSVLDHVRGDIERLRGVCGVGDRRVLDEHFESIRELEKQLDLLGSFECELPDLSGEIAQLPDPPTNGPISPPIWPDTAHANDLPLRSDVMQRLAVLALRCDLTRVVVLSMGPSSSRLTYPFLEMGNTDDHYFSHLQQDPSNRATQLEWNRLARWRFSEFAHLVERLKTPDGTGSALIDETLVVCGSELANGAGHTADMLPIVVAGNVGPMATAAGRNRHLTVPCNPNTNIFNNPATGVPTLMSSVSDACSSSGAYTPLANLWLTILGALGIQRPSFGDSTGTLSGLWV